MHIYVIFAHPSRRSFSRSVLDAFTSGLRDAGHSFEIADLYEMDFQSDMDEAQYLRETSGNPDLPVPRAVEDDQAKINRARGLAFIYPVWWSDCPVEHLEETGIAGAMRRVMLEDRLLGIGIMRARMEILGGMMPLDDSHREANLRRAYELGKDF